MGYDKKQNCWQTGKGPKHDLLYHGEESTVVCTVVQRRQVQGRMMMDVMMSSCACPQQMVVCKRKDPKYGFLPYMATHSRGSVSSLLASSYVERINSAVNLILTKGNTLLVEEEINMCTVLLMNHRFMEFMRKYHPDTANQWFKMTVISEDFLGSSDQAK